MSSSTEPAIHDQKCRIALPRKKIKKLYLSRCQVLLGSWLLPQLRRGGQTCDGVLRRIHLLLCPRENRQRKLLLQCSKFRLKSGKIDSFNKTKIYFGGWKWSDLFGKYSEKYSRDLNTDYLNTELLRVRISNSWPMWFVITLITEEIYRSIYIIMVYRILDTHFPNGVS